jgi:transposase
VRLPATIFVATQPTNLRLSFDRLAGLVRQQLGRDPRSDAVYVFYNKRRSHVKLIWHDGSGYRILFKRLDRNRGRFRIPQTMPDGAQHVRVSARELDVLLEGVDMKVIRAARRSMRAADTEAAHLS